MNLVFHEKPASIAVNEFGIGLTSINEGALKDIISSGDYGTSSYKQIAEWDEDIAPYPTEEEIQAAISIASWKRVRNERNVRLANTDWYGMSDITMSEEITAYRQALRDIPQTYSSSKDVIWPSLAADAVSTFLNQALLNDAEIVTVDSTDGFPDAGTIQIQDETITYDGRTNVTFSGCVRGTAGTTAVAHEDEVVVNLS
jgi:hypothetical protein